MRGMLRLESKGTKADAVGGLPDSLTSISYAV